MPLTDTAVKSARAGSRPRKISDGGGLFLQIQPSGGKLWRLAYRFDAPEPEVFDNRYMLTQADLPDASVLRTHGISRVLYVVDSLDDTEVEEDDLHLTFRALVGEGIGLSLIDLAWLEDHGAAPGLDLAFAEHPLRVEPRLTLIDDPLFFKRAHGGFGGLHGIGFGGRLGHVGPAAG